MTTTYSMTLGSLTLSNDNSLPLEPTQVPTFSQVQGEIDLKIAAQDLFTLTEAQSAIAASIAALVDSAPETLNTLAELAAAIAAGGDGSILTAITSLGADLSATLANEVARAQGVEVELETSIQTGLEAQNELSSRIDTEVTERATAVSDLGSDLQAAIVAAQNAANLAVTVENVRAVAAEQALDDRIDTLELIDIDAAVSVENVRALGAEDVLRVATAAETIRAQGVEGVIDKAVKDEATRAQGVESGLNDNLIKALKVAGDTYKVAPNQYLQIGDFWRLAEVENGKRLVFEHKNASGIWAVGIPFISSA